MAQETKIEFKDKGFWINEAFIEVISDFVCQAFESKGLNDFPSNLKNLYSNSIGNKSGEYVGMVGFSFDKNVFTSTDKNILTSIFDQAKVLINMKAPELSVQQLNQFEQTKSDPYFVRNWIIPVKTQSLIKTLEFMQQVINETWQSANAGIYYSGYPLPSGASAI